jgi:hypothetical protein
VEAEFCVAALNEAIHKFGAPEIMYPLSGHLLRKYPAGQWIRAASSRHLRGQIGCDGQLSVSRWTAKADSWTTSLSNDCGGA